MKKLYLLLFTLLVHCSLSANEKPQIDTAVMVDGISVTTLKQGLNLYREPITASVISEKSLERNGVTAIKDIAQIVPNLHIPDYGSRITSSIYIRGLGARIDQPVMGLNIDNVPFLNKNAFDLEVMDIERMEILRGPQSTLYGRNTMGGVINIYTLSPFNYQGTKLRAEYSSGNSYRLQLSTYNQHSDNLASSISIYNNSSDGLFENSYTGEMCDTEQSFGGRLKIGYRANSKLRVENTLSLSDLEQGGYPYSQIALGAVSYNDPSSYDRQTISNGTTIKYDANNFSIASITGYQYLNDEMTLDNDFTEEEYFILTQAIQEHSITEDIILRSNRDGNYNYLIGAFGFFKSQNMQAPVTFKEYGIESLILGNANEYFAPNKYVWNEESFTLNSDFLNSTYGGAIYHESTYDTPRWRATFGLRFDYEQAYLDYRSYTNTSCSLVDSDENTISNKDISVTLRDKLSQSFVELLPKLSLQYRFGNYYQSSIFGSISKGYKAGGYNTQMFSDILQQRVMQEFGVTLGEVYDVDEVIAYKPEYSWNYEIGSHLESTNRNLIVDAAIFYIDCHDQQLTVFPEGQTTGRMMTNAGRSRSYGAEISMVASLTQRITLSSSYGYTNAKFIQYTSGDSDYAGNYVPYSPKHTLFAELSYTLPINRSWAERVIFAVNTKGAGPIYWNEENSIEQPLYALLNANVTLYHKRYTLALWGRNLTDVAYDQFYFKSIGNEFTQSGRPLTTGITLTINI